jgi:lipopolysaccharide transport protein LptA
MRPPPRASDGPGSGGAPAAGLAAFALAAGLAGCAFALAAGLAGCAFALVALPRTAAAAVASLAVAPFEAEAAPGALVPDVATLLADRLATRGVARVVGPAELGAARQAEPADADVRAWAARAGVQGVVVGRTTRIDDRLSLDARLRAGDSGAVSGTFVQQVEQPDELESAIDSLAARIIEQSAALAPAAASPPDAAPAVSSAPFGLEGWKSEAPLSIESDELEAVQKDGRRRLIFEKNVRVRQGDMSLDAARLEAFYPAGGSQPERLVATGAVRLENGDQQARCDEAVYDRPRGLVTCRGAAHFQEGENQLAGDVIEIDLERETVRVKGGASIVIQPDTLERGDDAS